MDFRKPRVAIIDADSIVWNTAYIASNSEGQWKPGLDYFLEEMLTNLQVQEYVGYVGSAGPTIRTKLFPSYKANRPERPEFFTEFGANIRFYLFEKWGFDSSPPGYEADDAVATAATLAKAKGWEPVICGIDKDLKQIVGEHYDYNKKKTILVSQGDADWNLATQLLVGDSTDNVAGVPGIGPARATKILDATRDFSLSALIRFVVSTYISKFGEREGLEKFAETYLLVRLKENLPMELITTPWGPK